MKRIFVFAGLLTCVGLFVAISVVRAAPVRAQQQPLSRPQAAPTPLAFEVASIKPDNVFGTGGGIRFGCHGSDREPPFPIPLGRCIVRRNTLRQLIEHAYSLPSGPGWIIGGPVWLNSDRYAIEGKAEDASATTQQLTLMMQSLLGDRFKLVTHRETKDVLGYALVVAKAGPKVKKADSDEGQSGVFISSDGVTGANITVAEFTNFLSIMMVGPVVDETDLKGTYNFNLHWVPANGAWGNLSSADGVDPSGTSFLSALQDQLGLRLERQKVQFIRS